MVAYVYGLSLYQQISESLETHTQPVWVWVTSGLAETLGRGGPPGSPLCLPTVDTPLSAPLCQVSLRRPEVSRTRRNAVRAGVFGVGGTDTVRVFRYQNGIMGCRRIVVGCGRVGSFGLYCELESFHGPGPGGSSGPGVAF